MEVITVNSVALAYLGDAIYELEIRKYLINKGLVKVNDMQNEAIKYVSAESQASYLKKLLDKNIFNEDELEVIKNARNSKIHSKPKSCDVLTYKHATALEALFGYYYLNNNYGKIEDLVEIITSM